MTSANRSGGSRQSTPLQPPSTSAPAETTRSTNFRYVVIAFSLLLVTGLGVVLLLPKWVSDATHAPTVEQDEGTSGRDTTELRQQAEQALQQFLRVQAEMKLANAPVWGSAEWHEAETRVRAGDRLFGERRFGEAQQSYEAGTASLETLKKERAGRLESALQAGKDALGQNKVNEALDHFETALSIDAENAEALQGKAQAQVRDQVLQLMAAAGEAEENAQFDFAVDHLLSALRLDNAYAPASEALVRVENKLKDRIFHTAMDRALKSLDAGRFDEAARALAEAAEVHPLHEALVDARQRFRLERHRAAMNQLRRQAVAHAKAENWTKAVDLYTRAIKRDANAGFARQGLARAQQRAKLNALFDSYIKDPERLYSSAPLADAEQLLESNSKAPGNEPKLAGKIERLRVLIAQARQPLQVELRSDGETEVTIYHVGRLGRFMDRQLSLRPGTYTATGVRAGYRDVRRVFSLKPGDGLTTVDVRCVERI